jgi:DNA-binding transcriptional LysR family regulator
VRIIEDDSSGLKRLLAENQIDMAFLPHTHPFSDDLCAQLLTQLQNVCCVHKTHRLAAQKSICLEQLQDEPLVLFKNSFFQTERILGEFSRLSCQPKIALYTAQLSTMQNMIISSNAVGFMFEFLTKSTPELVGIPLDPPMTTQVSLVWKKSRPISGDMKNLIVFTRHLAESAEELFKKQQTD